MDGYGQINITNPSGKDIVIGKLISGFAQGGLKGVVVGAVIFFLTPFRFPFQNLAIYLLFIALGAMIFSCLGTVCGTTIDKPENIGAAIQEGMRKGGLYVIDARVSPSTPTDPYAKVYFGTVSQAPLLRPAV